MWRHTNMYLLHPYPGLHNYTEGATRDILDLFTETFLVSHRQKTLAHILGSGVADAVDSKD